MSFPGFNSPGDRRRRLSDIQSVVHSLRADLSDAPDLTDSILARVDEHRPFTDRRTRGLMLVGRLGAAAAVALVVLGVTLAYRYAPSATGWAGAPEPRPLSNVVEIAQTSASSGYQTFLTTFQAINAPAAPVQFRVAAPELAAKPGVPFVCALVVPVNRLGKVTVVCVARPARPGAPSPAVVTAMCLRPILSDRAYEQVLTYAAAARPPARSPALIDDFLPPLPGRADDAVALPR